MKYYGIEGVRLNAEQAKLAYPDFMKWMDGVFRGWSIDSSVLMLQTMEVPAVQTETEGQGKIPSGLYVYFFTEKHEYRISVRLPDSEYIDSEYTGYLGGSAGIRAPRPGEDWLRGNDLSDGPYTQETFNAIMHDIVRWELLPLDIREAGTVTDKDVPSVGDASDAKKTVVEPMPVKVTSVVITNTDGTQVPLEQSSEPVPDQVAIPDSVLSPATEQPVAVPAPVDPSVVPVTSAVATPVDSVPVTQAIPTPTPDPMGGTPVLLSEDPKDHT